MKFAIVLGAAACVAACASSSSDSISPMSYQNFTCQQIAEEARSVSSRAAQVAGVQDSKRTNDAGEMEALERASIQKQCGVQFRQQQKIPGP
jgi:hypothetical protein